MTVTVEPIQSGVVAVSVQASSPVEVLVPASPIRVEFVPLGPPGRTGDTGPPGPNGGDVGSFVATENISALRVVSEGAGGVALTNPSSIASLSTIRGIAVQSASANGAVNVRGRGLIVDPAWSWVPGSAIFVSAAGMLTATPPTSVAIRIIGVALSSTSIFVDIQDLVLL